MRYNNKLKKGTDQVSVVLRNNKKNLFLVSKMYKIKKNNWFRHYLTLGLEKQFKILKMLIINGIEK